MDINIKIEKRGEAPGTIGWLASRAAAIRVGATTAGGRAAWLVGREGDIIDCLAAVDGEGEFSRLDADFDEFAEDPNTIACKHPYTKAAWQVMEQLIEEAVESLGEPAELAQAYRVTVGPKDELLAAMLKAASDDPAVRPALIDYINNCGE